MLHSVIAAILSTEQTDCIDMIVSVLHLEGEFLYW